MSYNTVNVNGPNLATNVRIEGVATNSGTSASTMMGWLDDLYATYGSNNNSMSDAIAMATGSNNSGITVQNGVSNSCFFEAWASGDTSSITSGYFGASQTDMPSAESVIKLFEGLGEDATVEDFTTAWLKSNFPDMSDEELKAINEQYAGHTKEMTDYYKGLEKEYEWMLDEDANAEEVRMEDVDITEYYMKILDERYPELSAEEKANICQEYKKQYDEYSVKFKELEEKYGTEDGEEMSLNEYFTDFIKQANPNMSDEEVAKIVAAYEKNSEPLVKYYSELEEYGKKVEEAEAAKAGGSKNIGPRRSVNDKTVRGLLNDANSMVGLSEHNSSDAAKINQVTRESGINCQTTPWCAAWAMNMLNDHGILDVSSCANRNYCPEIVNWSKGQGIWRTKSNYTPQAGDAILFDWSGNASGADHVGIVEKVENGYVYTIEGNSGDAVSKRKYAINSNVIMGYVDCAAQKK